MSFDIPDWGGSDSFTYYTDSLVFPETCSKISGNEVIKGKKRCKKKDQDFKDSHTGLKKRKTSMTNSSIEQNDVELSVNHTKPLSSLKKKTHQDVNSEGKELKNEATNSSTKQNDIGLVYQNKPLTYPKRSQGKKGKEKKIHQTEDSEGRELKNEGTNKPVTRDDLHSGGYVDDVLSPKTSTKKKKKRKNNNKYKELNTEQKKLETAQGNTLGVQDGFGGSVSGNINEVVNCDLDSEIVGGTTALLQQKGKKSKVCDKDKNQKRKKKRVQLKNIQVSCPEKCTVQSKNASEQYDATEIEKGNYVLSSETEGLNTKKIDGKQSNKSKVANQKIVAENEICSESIVKENTSNKKEVLHEPKIRVMNKTLEKGKKTTEVKDEKQNKQLTNKKRKKAKMDNEISDELLFNVDDGGELDPRFQSDFETLLKELNFGRFHGPEPKKDKNKKMNGSSYTSVVDSELDRSKEPAASVQDENKDVHEVLRDSEMKEEDGPQYAKIKDGKEILEIVEKTGFENLENDEEEDVEVGDSNGSDDRDGKANPQTENIHGSLKCEKTRNTVNKKVKGKKIDKEKYEMKNVTCVKSVTKDNEKRKFDKSKLARILDEANTTKQLKQPAVNSVEVLKQKMLSRLAVARFRMVNEELYTSSSTDSSKVFKDNSEAFAVYHAGYQAQVRRWPVNPLDLIVMWLSNKSTEWVVADFGCGEAALSLRVPQKKVYSLDLVAANSKVIACNMAHSPLQSASVDVVVFCLSLMSSNIKDFIVEANRVLREGGIMKIAEVESRFGDIQQFVNLLGKYGFHCTQKDTSQTYFFIFEFKKNRKLKKTIGLPEIILKPCIYKKR